jgi:hypothetical protein
MDEGALEHGFNISLRMSFVTGPDSALGSRPLSGPGGDQVVGFEIIEDEVGRQAVARFVPRRYSYMCRTTFLTYSSFSIAARCGWMARQAG